MSFEEDKIYGGGDHWWKINAGWKFEIMILPETIFLGELDPDGEIPGEGQYYSHDYFLKGRGQNWVRNCFSEEILQKLIETIKEKIETKNKTKNK